MKWIFVFSFLLTNIIFCQENNQTKSNLPSIGAKTEANFFLKNKRNFINQYIEKFVPQIEKQFLTTNNLKISDELKKYLQQINNAIEKINLDQSITQDYIKAEEEKAKLLKLLLDTQEAIIHLLKEIKAKTNTCEKYNGNLGNHKSKLNFFREKLKENKLVKELELSVKELENFLESCKNFKSTSSEKLQKLKQERLELHKKTAEAYNIDPDKFMSWWNDYIKFFE